MEANFQGIVNIVYIIVIIILWIKSNKKRDKDNSIADLRYEIQRKADQKNLERIESNQNEITKNYLDRFDEVNRNLSAGQDKMMNRIGELHEKINKNNENTTMLIERIDNLPCRKDINCLHQ